jgi:hypothetical protein
MFFTVQENGRSLTHLEVQKNVPANVSSCVMTSTFCHLNNFLNSGYKETN